MPVCRREVGELRLWSLSRAARKGATVGTAPNRQYILEWRTGGSTSVDAEIIFYENNPSLITLTQCPIMVCEWSV